MKKNMIYAIVLLGGLAVTAVYATAQSVQKNKNAVEQQTTQYTCPMHHDVVMDKPGKCPICGMTLVEMNKDQQGMMMHTNGDSTHIGQNHMMMNDSTKQMHHNMMNDSDSMMNHHHMNDSTTMHTR